MSEHSHPASWSGPDPDPDPDPAPAPEPSNEKQEKFNELSKLILSREWDVDDNMDILIDIIKRMIVGKGRYQHGLCADDDTRTYGTSSDSWVEMALQELSDALVYTSTAAIRVMKNQRKYIKVDPSEQKQQ